MYYCIHYRRYGTSKIYQALFLNSVMHEHKCKILFYHYDRKDKLDRQFAYQISSFFHQVIADFVVKHYMDHIEGMIKSGL